MFNDSSIEMNGEQVFRDDSLIVVVVFTLMFQLAVDNPTFSRAVNGVSSLTVLGKITAERGLE